MKHSTDLRSFFSFAEHRINQLIGMALLLTMLLAGSVCYGQSTTPTNTTAVAPQDVLSSHDPHKDIQNLMAHYKVRNFEELSDLSTRDMILMWNNFVQFLVENPKGSYLTHPEIVSFRDELWGYLDLYAPTSLDRSSYAQLVEASNIIAALDKDILELKNKEAALDSKAAALDKDILELKNKEAALDKDISELNKVARMMGIKFEE